MGQILSRIVAAILLSGLVGGLLTALLTAFGDRQAKYEGRLTANPFAHVTLSGIFLAIAFQATWFLRVPVTFKERSLKPLAAVLVVLSIMLALVPVLDLFRPYLHAGLPRTLGYMALNEIDELQVMLVNSATIGILPIPGMLMGMAMPAILPSLEKRYRKWVGFGFSGVAVIMILGWFPNLKPLVEALRLI